MLSQEIKRAQDLDMQEHREENVTVATALKNTDPWLSRACWMGKGSISMSITDETRKMG